ncbi:peptidoglycan DD-metalloendopeptidase family protein [Sungkyunkwania multivorans]|uniref:Peptidoglycan DD-metalloendopeptidase family protein n=1 Tax=Sungkyunkwania multivorans TaxID=1173618 RepID=A0ABW3CWC5_9FLAO
MLENLLKAYSQERIAVVDASISFKKYALVDLSVQNERLENVDQSDPKQFQDFLDAHLTRERAKVAYGGYNEERGLYENSEQFNSTTENARNIHLGIDFWVGAGTPVLAAMDGEVHSFKDNNAVADYGPTIILKHRLEDQVFYSLYGHLSRRSLQDMNIGKIVKKGDVIATLGTPEENVNYAPHLHFQLIKDLQGNNGDYPGVCSKAERDFYLANCPDPNLLLKI